MASSKGRVDFLKEITRLQKGQNSSTCDPWTARDFLEDIRRHSAQCQHCLSGIENSIKLYLLDQFYIVFGCLCFRCQNYFSDCNHITYSSTVTSAEFRWIPGWVFSLRLLLWTLFHSSCDSRNLNLSPFCNLISTSLAMWQPNVLETYGNQTTSYINATSGPMRRNFPNSMGKRELITSLTKVWFIYYIDGSLMIFRTWPITTLMRRTSPLWTSSLESQLCTVSL